MKKDLILTDDILDKLGFSPYWSGSGEFGTRQIKFESSGDIFRIVEMDQQDGFETGGYFDDYYVPQSFYFDASFCVKGSVEENAHSDLTYLRELYDVVDTYYHNSLEEFVDRLKNHKMLYWLEDYINEKK